MVLAACARVPRFDGGIVVDGQIWYMDGEAT